MWRVLLKLVRLPDAWNTDSVNIDLTRPMTWVWGWDYLFDRPMVDVIFLNPFGAAEMTQCTWSCWPRKVCSVCVLSQWTVWRILMWELNIELIFHTLWFGQRFTVTGEDEVRDYYGTFGGLHSHRLFKSTVSCVSQKSLSSSSKYCTYICNEVLLGFPS